jgi:hypothetical protein
MHLSTLPEYMGLAATLIAVLSGFHGRWNDVISAALVMVPCMCTRLRRGLW